MSFFLKSFTACAILITASLVTWHKQYEEVPHGIIPLALTEPLTGWSIKPHNQYKIIDDPHGPLLHLSRQQRSEKAPAINAWFDPSPQVHAILVKLQARWTDVKAGKEGYHIARITSHMRTKEGLVRHPPDFSITSGTGTRDWHSVETALLVTKEMANLGLSIAMLGDRGTLEVKDLHITALRHRSWLPYAVAAILLGWSFFCLSLLRHINPSLPLGRAIAGSLLITATGWYFVFPQPKTKRLPIIGSFALPALSTTPSAASTSRYATTPKGDSPQTPLAAKPKAPSSAPSPPQAKKASPPTVPAVSPTASPEITQPPLSRAHRSSAVLYQFFRTTKRHFLFIHLLLFFAFTLTVLFITNDPRQWRVPAAVAVLAELIPELTEHIGDRGDIIDLTQNLAGVFLALYLWKKFFQKSPAL